MSLPTVDELDDIQRKLASPRARENAAQLLQLCKRGLDVAVLLGDARHELRFRAMLASTFCLTDAYVDAYEHIIQALDLAMQLREMGDEIEVRALLGTVLTRVGRPAEAQEQRVLALKLANEWKDARVSAGVANRIALDLLYQGQLAAARKLVEHSLDLTQYMQSFVGRGSQLHTAALVAIEQARWDDALTFIDEAERAQTMFPSLRWDAELGWARARVLRGLGKPNEALQLAFDLPDRFAALNLQTRSYGAAVFRAALTGDIAKTRNADKIFGAVDRAYKLVVEQRDTHAARVMSEAINANRQLAELPRLRDQILKLELQLLGLGLSAKTSQRSRTAEVFGLDSANVVRELDGWLAQQVLTKALVRVELFDARSGGYEMLQTLHCALDRNMPQPTRLLARSPAIGYFLAAGAGARRVAGAIAEMFNETSVALPARQTLATGLVPRHFVSAVVVKSSMRPSAIELLGRLEKVATQQNKNGGPLVRVHRVR